MFEAVGLQVDKLSRTRFGHLDLTGLRPGESRRLNKKRNQPTTHHGCNQEIMKRILIAPVRFYQRFISPAFPPLVALSRLVPTI